MRHTSDPDLGVEGEGLATRIKAAHGLEIAQMTGWLRDVRRVTGRQPEMEGLLTGGI